MKYWVIMPLRVVGFEGDLADAVEPVVDQLVALDECTPELLDFAVSTNTTDHSVELELTVAAPNLEAALQTGISCIRAAIHATGADTPGWDDRGPSDSPIRYEVDERDALEARPLLDA